MTIRSPRLLPLFAALGLALTLAGCVGYAGGPGYRYGPGFAPRAYGGGYVVPSRSYGYGGFSRGYGGGYSHHGGGHHGWR